MKNYIESKGKKVLLTREPGGSRGGEELRELLVSGDANRWDPISETLIIYAARREHWVKKIKRIVGDKEKISFTCELKYDGVSIGLLYEQGLLVQALTRGDGINGDDITENVRTIPTIPLVLNKLSSKKIEARGEILMPNRSFEKLNLKVMKIIEQ